MYILMNSRVYLFIGSISTWEIHPRKGVSIVSNISIISRKIFKK